MKKNLFLILIFSMILFTAAAVPTAEGDVLAAGISDTDQNNDFQPDSTGTAGNGDFLPGPANTAQNSDFLPDSSDSSLQDTKNAQSAPGSDFEDDKDSNADEELYENADFAEMEEYLEVDNDALLYRYIDHALLGDKEETVNLKKQSINTGERLTKTNRIVYDGLRPAVAKIAGGQLIDTRVQVSLAESEYAGKKWFAQDLGIESLGTVEDGKFVPAPDFKAAFYSAIGYNASKTIICLLRDCPLDMYWFGNSYIATTPYKIFRQTSSGQLYATIHDTLTVKFAASSDYAMPGEGAEKTSSYTSKDGTETFYYDPYTINSETINSVNNAIANAKQIAKENTGKNDYDRIFYNFDKVKNLSGYNREATEYYPGNPSYGNPWQLIYLFDGDPATKVICEGYSKGMQYLCNMTEFDSSLITCYCVTGDLYRVPGGSLVGYHMWNIVHMDDGKNYFIDITNSSAANPWGFLAPYSSGSVKDGYCIAEKYRYAYRDIERYSYTTEELTLTDIAYGEAPPEEVSAVVSADGILLQWSENPIADGSAVYKSTDGKEYRLVLQKASNAEIDPKDNSFWLDTDVQNGIKYSYVVCYYKEFGGKTHLSANSDAAVCVFLNAPEITGLGNAPSYTCVSWTENDQADGVAISRKDDDFTIVRTAANNGIDTWTDTYAIAAGEEYSYRVQAYKDVDGVRYYSAPSETKTIMHLNQPKLGSISAVKTGTTISWESAPGAAEIRILRGTTPEDVKNIATITSGAAGFYKDPAIPDYGTAYYYRVIAASSTAESSPSAFGVTRE